MDSKRIISFLLLILCTLLSSCSIKEDRSGCPCYLTVDLSQVLNASLTPPSWWDRDLRIALLQDGTTIRESRVPYEEAQPEYVYQVPKGSVWVTGVLGLDAGLMTDGVVRYPEGQESDCLYVSSRLVPCEGEEARCVLEMYKQFSRIEILGLESFDYRMVVTAGCSGLDLRTREALEGRFRFPIRCEEDGSCHFRLPRQQSDDLMILLLDKQDGHLDNSIPLGRFLTDIGYDWNAASLSDVTVRVDFVTLSVSITISDWDRTVEFPFTV